MSYEIATLNSRIGYRHRIGIPTGSDHAPFFANLFLHYYISRWILQLRKSGKRRARRFAITFRFIDDLTTINDG